MWIGISLATQEEPFPALGNQLSGCFEAQGQVIGASTYEETFTLVANPIRAGRSCAAGMLDGGSGFTASLDDARRPQLRQGYSEAPRISSAVRPRTRP